MNGDPPHKTALCHRCTRLLDLDDRCVQKYATQSTDGEVSLKYKKLGTPDPFNPTPHFVNVRIYGGIRFDADISTLSSGAKSGCKFCRALKQTLYEKYCTSSWWMPDSGELRIRVQYEWTGGFSDLHLNAIVASVHHSSIPGWQSDAFQFLVYAQSGNVIALLEIGLRVSQ